jgi:hypothetical protein
MVSALIWLTLKLKSDLSTIRWGYLSGLMVVALMVPALLLFLRPMRWYFALLIGPIVSGLTILGIAYLVDAIGLA